MRTKIRIYSGKNIEKTFEQLKDLSSKLEEKEEESIGKLILRILKMPVLGKPRKSKR